jgi:hypothetical protein
MKSGLRDPADRPLLCLTLISYSDSENHPLVF